MQNAKKGKLTTVAGTDKTCKQAVTIAAPNMQTVVFKIRGTAPFVQHKFSQKAREQIKATQEAGSRSRKGSKRKPKDFAECWRAATRRSVDGWYGIPAPAFRNAAVSACRTVGFQMVKAKLALFIEPDGFDADDGMPLVKLEGTLRPQEESIMPVRLQTGVIDLRCRPMFESGWTANLRVRFDGDMFGSEDVANLVARIGLQVGIGEGRPDSKKSTGMGWGLFEIVND